MSVKYSTWVANSSNELDPALEVLHRGHPHRVGQALVRGDRRHVRMVLQARVAPHQMHRVAERIVVRGHIGAQQADHLEVVVELEAQRRIAALAVDHGLHVGLGAAVALHVLRQPGDAAAEHDAAQFQVGAQALACLVQPLADAHAAIVRMHHHFHAVQPVAVGLVPRAHAAAGDLRPGMRRQRGGFVDAEGGAIADDLAFVLDHELAFREMRLL